MQGAISSTFDTFIGTLYDSGLLPPVAVLDFIDDGPGILKATGRVPVLSEDESEYCPVFGNWGTYYAFEGWRSFRAGHGNEFQLMVHDVLMHAGWTPETVKWIGIIDGLVRVQHLYADKFGHHPADMNKFIKSLLRYGEDTVLLCDRY